MSMHGKFRKDTGEVRESVRTIFKFVVPGTARTRTCYLTTVRSDELIRSPSATSERMEV